MGSKYEQDTDERKGRKNMIIILGIIKLKTSPIKSEGDVNKSRLKAKL